MLKLNRFKKAVIISILVHFIFAVTVSKMDTGKTKGDGNGDGDGDSEKTEIFIVEEVKIPTSGKSDDGDIAAPPEAVNPEKDCKRGYEGIGVMMNGSLFDVVAKGSPAEKAGILPMDRILDQDQAEIRGPKGTKITFIIERGQERLTITVTRGNICDEVAP